MAPAAATPDIIASRRPVVAAMATVLDFQKKAVTAAATVAKPAKAQTATGVVWMEKTGRMADAREISNEPGNTYEQSMRTNTVQQ